MNVEKPKTPNMPANPMGASPVIGAGVPVGDPMMANTGFGNIAAEAAEDVPF